MPIISSVVSWIDSIKERRTKKKITLADEVARTENARLRELVIELRQQIRELEEKRKVDQISIDMLMAVNTREHERVKAEAAIATFQATQLGVIANGNGSR